MHFKVSLAQINPVSGDIDGNARAIVEGILEARRRQADLVVFPEMCLSGYCLDEKLLNNHHFLASNRRVLLEEIAPAAQGTAAIVGFLDYEEEKQGPDGGPVRYNAAAVLAGGRLVQIVHKRLLPAYRYFDDKRYFAPGQEVEPCRLELAGGRHLRVGVLICEDLWEAGYGLDPCRVYREKGAECLIAINASPFVASRPGQQDGKRFERLRVARRAVRRHGLPLVYVNTVGAGDNGKNIILFDGLSFVLDAAGEMAAVLPQFSEAQASVTLDSGRASPVEEPSFDREEEIYRALIMGVRDYYRKIGIFRCVLEAISGGIDSALGAAIAVDAMGPELVRVYNLPSRYNSGRTQEAALRLARNLGLECCVVPIQGMVDQIVGDFEQHLHPIRHGVTLENLQARVRGLVMMAESNDRQGLLLTNGNETEIALGYATLYGDMAGGLSVIGDLSKPDVYRLARHVNRRQEREVIPREIFETSPSAELSQDQVDPFDYDVVGPLVSQFTEKGLSTREMARLYTESELARQAGLDPEDLAKRYTRQEFETLTRDLFEQLNAAVYKRLQGAPIVVVSRRAFGFDLRETLINGWKG